MTQHQEDERSRRKYGLLLFITLVAVGLLLALTPSAVMAATLDISDGTVTTDNGAVTGVTVDVGGDITWDGAENAPGDTDIILEVKSSGGSWETVATESAGSLSGLAGTYSYNFNDADVTSTSWNNGDFKASGDGSVTETTLEFRVTVESQGDINGDGNNPDTASATDTAKVTVTNEDSSQGVGGTNPGNGVNPQGTDQNP